MNIIEFDKRYVGKMVRVRLKSRLLEPTDYWVDEEQEYVGKLKKVVSVCEFGCLPKKGNFYLLEGALRLGCSVFVKSDFLSIKLVKTVIKI